MRAESELLSLLANQQPNGLVPHVTFWQREVYEERLADYSIAYRTPYLSDCMQPPLLAEAVAAVAARDRGKPFLREVLPAVRRCRGYRSLTIFVDRTTGAVAVATVWEQEADRAAADPAFRPVLQRASEFGLRPVRIDLLEQVLSDVV